MDQFYPGAASSHLMTMSPTATAEAVDPPEETTMLYTSDSRCHRSRRRYQAEVEYPSYQHHSEYQTMQQAFDHQM